jgi:hypothetical protein
LLQLGWRHLGNDARDAGLIGSRSARIGRRGRRTAYPDTQPDIDAIADGYPGAGFYAARSANSGSGTRLYATGSAD